MSKITVRRSDGEIIKVDEKKLKGDMKRIREKERRKVRKAAPQRRRRRPSDRPSGSSSANRRRPPERRPVSQADISSAGERDRVRSRAARKARRR